MNNITTTCRHCIFATWSLGIDHNEQSGCKLGRLEKFIKQDKAKLNEKVSPFHYDINGYCSTCRTKGWLEDNKIEEKDAEKKVLEEVENKTTFDVVVNLSSENPSVVNDIISYLNQLSGKVNHVHVITKVDKKLPISLYHEFAKLKWPRSVEILAEETLFEFALWNRIEKSPAWGTLVVENNAYVPSYLINMVQTWLHKDLKMVSLVKGKGYYLMPNQILRVGMINQTQDCGIIESVIKLAKEQKAKNTIINMNEG